MNGRRLLEASALGAVGTIAGCFGSDEATDDTGDGDESEEEESNGGVFGERFDGEYDSIARWLPAPSVLDADPYRINTMSPAELVAADDVIDQDAGRLVQDLFTDLVVEPPASSAVDQCITVRYGDHLSPSAPSSLVATGEIDAAAMTATLEERGYDHVRSEGGYEIYDGTDAYAVNEEVLLSSRGPGSLEILEAIIDAEQGRVERYADANEGIGRLADALPAGHMTFIGPTDPDEEPIPGEHVIADGTVLQVEGTETLQGIAFVLEDGSSVDDGAAEELFGGENGSEDTDGTAMGVDDGVLWVHERQPTAEIDF